MSGIIASIAEGGLCPPSRLLRWVILQILEEGSDVGQPKTMRNVPLWVLFASLPLTARETSIMPLNLSGLTMTPQ